MEEIKENTNKWKDNPPPKKKKIAMIKKAECQRTDAEAETPILWPLIRRTDSLEKTLMLGGIGGRRRRGRQRIR